MTQPKCARCGEFEMPGHICVDILASLAADRQEGVMSCYDVFYTEEFMRQHREMLALLHDALVVTDPHGQSHTITLPNGAPVQGLCPNCGARMGGATPAQPKSEDAFDPDHLYHAPPPAKDANVTNEPPPSGYMSRPKLL